MCPQGSAHIRRSWPNIGSQHMIDPYIGISENHRFIS
jgi:hypothetical protein